MYKLFFLSLLPLCKKKCILLYLQRSVCARLLFSPREENNKSCLATHGAGLIMFLWLPAKCTNFIRREKLLRLRVDYLTSHWFDHKKSSPVDGIGRWRSVKSSRFFLSTPSFQKCMCARVTHGKYKIRRATRCYIASKKSSFISLARTWEVLKNLLAHLRALSLWRKTNGHIFPSQHIIRKVYVFNINWQSLKLKYKSFCLC